MSVSTEPYRLMLTFPAKEEEKQAVKKTIITNYINGGAPDISLPKVSTGGIVPFVMGRELITNPDLMWYGNLKPIIERKTKQETETDPNTGDETITTTVTTTIVGYTIDVQFCLGVGPGMRLRSILSQNESVWVGTQGPARTTFTVPGTGDIKDVIFAGGNFDQIVDPYLQGLIPQQIPAWRGIAYVVLKSLDTSKLKNLSFEVDRYPDPLGLGAHNKIGEDINPISAIAAVITSKWGGAGRDIATIGDSFTDLAEQCYTEANGASMSSRSIASANDIAGILLDQVDATMWEDHDTGKLELTPIRKNFDRTDLVRVFDRDITKITQMDKTSWQSIPTSLILKYFDRAQKYSEIPIAARNLAISSKINKSSKTMSFPAVRVGSLAAKILAREGASSGSPTQLVQITTNRKTASCNPGDIILITCEKYKYYSVPAIVLKRRTQPITDNSVTLLVSVILYPNNNLLFAAPEDSFFVPVDPNPHAPTDVKVASAPWAFRATKPLRNYGTGGSIDTNYIWNTTYDQLLFFGNAYSAAQETMIVRYHDTVRDEDVVVATRNNEETTNFSYRVWAKLTVAIDKYDNWDGASTTHQIQIKNIGPAIAGFANLVNSTLANNAFIIMIDDEVFFWFKSEPGSTIVFSEGLRTATFTGVRRALADTVAQNHAVNAQVTVTWSWNFNTSVTGFTIGVNTDFKCTSLASPKGVRTESDIGSPFLISYTATDRANRPLRPHNTKISGARGTSSPTALVLGATPTITWNIRGRSISNGFTPHKDLPYQTDADQPGEVLSGKHIVYRVWIKDSANVEWDCGATADTADHNSIVATVPLGAAVGVGELWVDAEFDNGFGVYISQYKDKLPISLS